MAEIDALHAKYPANCKRELSSPFVDALVYFRYGLPPAEAAAVLLGCKRDPVPREERDKGVTDAPH